MQSYKNCITISIVILQKIDYFCRNKFRTHNHGFIKYRKTL